MMYKCIEKRLLVTITLSLVMMLKVMAQASQPCVVMQYNQRQPKTPLAGVEVMVSNAGSTVSAADGTLTLVFRTLKPGDKVHFISAKKAGFEVMNKMAVEQWNISRNNSPFSIILVNSNYFSQLKGKLTQTSTESYKAKYEQAVRELEQQKKENKLMEEEFNQKYDELDEKYREQLKNLDNYIDQFARIDLSEVSAEEQQILDMVQEGKIQEAVQAYDKLELAKKLTSETNDYLELGKVVKTAEELRGQKRGNIDALYESIYRQVSTMVMADNHEGAIKVLLSAMSDFSRLFDEDPATNRPQFADLQFRIGELMADHQLGGEKNAGEYFASALSNYLILCDSLPEQYLASVANVKIRLGKCKQYELDYGSAESLYLEALDIWKQQKEQDSLKYLKELASTQQLLGRLYSNWNSRQDQSIDYFQAALDNYTLLTQDDKLAYLPDVAYLKFEMARFFNERHDLEKAENYLLKAQDDYALLAENNPEYLETLEDCQRELGDFYAKIWRGFKTLSERNPENLEVLETKQKELGVYGNLWNDFKTGDLFAKAEKHYKAACQTALRNDKELRLISRWNWDDLSNLYLENGESQKAEECIREYYEILAKYENSPLMEDFGAKALYDMAESYRKDGYPEKALPYYQDAMRMGLHKGDDLNTAMLHLDMALCHMLMGDSTKMVESMTAAFNLLDLDSKKDNTEKNLLLLQFAMSVQKVKVSLTVLTLLERQQNVDRTAFDLLFQENYTQLLLQHYTYNYKQVAEAQRVLGETYEEVEQYDKAEQSFIAAFESLEKLKKEQQGEFVLYPDMAKVQSCLGELYFYSLKDTLKAEECFLNAINQYTLAEKYTVNTYQSFDDLISFDKNKYKADISNIQLMLGILYYYKDENEKADSLLKLAYNNYVLYFETHPNKRVDKDDIATIARIAYYETMTLYYMSKMEEFDEWLSLAIECYEQLHEKYPNNKFYNDRLFNLMYYQARREADLNKPDESIELLVRCQEMGNISDKRLAAGFNAAAYAYVRGKEYEKALKTIECAIAIQPEEANYYDSKGEILLMQGDEDSALKMWQKVLELDSDFLKKHEGETELYKQLKERGLIE